MSRRVLDDRYVLAVKAVWQTGQFSMREIAKIFLIDRTTVKRYIQAEIEVVRVKSCFEGQEGFD
jgi:response regulator of citrate/malate metabolism